MNYTIDPVTGRFVVQRNAPTGVPIAVRTSEDPLFGPVVSFGISGPVIELLGDPARRAAYGRAGREWVEREFSTEAMVRGISAFLAQHAARAHLFET